jgi:hypothetical protein
MTLGPPPKPYPSMAGNKEELARRKANLIKNNLIKNPVGPSMGALRVGMSITNSV